MRSMGRFAALFALASLGLSVMPANSHAQHAIVNILATADGDIRSSTGIPGKFDTVDSTALSVGPNFDLQRGAIEFSLGAIPKGATINSAAFITSVDITAGTGNITVDFGAYPGDGIIEAADATASNSIVGSYTRDATSIVNFDASIPIDNTAIQSIFNSHKYVGLNLWRDPASSAQALGFSSLENGNGFARPPTLAIDYTVVPEPSVPACLGLCILALTMRRRHFRTSFTM